MSRNSQIRYREKHPTITLTCESKQQYANIVQQAKKQNLSISDYLKKVILSDINSFNEGKRIGYKNCDGEWQAIIDEDFVSKEDATKKRKESYNKGYWKGVKEVTKEIEEKDNLNTNLNNKNIDLNNDNTALREKNADLNEYIENFLDNAGRREKIACVEEQNKLERGKSSLDRYIRRLSNWRSDLVQRDKDQNRRNGEQDERDKKLNGVQKLLEDQADKQQIERKKIIQEQDERDKKVSEVQKLLEDQKDKQQIKNNELEQKEYELKQKEDAITLVKKDLMDFSREIGQEFSELIRVKQKIERNKHLLFLTEYPSNISLIP